jgi:RNA polymerase sigma-70 factor (ECF subfamily)
MRFRRRNSQSPGEAPTGAASGDGTLVLAAKLDPGAFGALYERYADDVLVYCYRRLGDWEDAADAAQQVFTNAFAKLSSFEDRGNTFRGWLFTIAHNEAIARQRRLIRRPEEPLPKVEEPLDPAPTPEDLATRDDEHRRLQLLLGRLTPTCRRVVELRLAELTDKQIAVVLGMSDGAVRAAQSRAVDQLRTLMGCDLAQTGGRHG